MLYKVTPALAPPARRTRAGEGVRPKKRRASAVFDADGHEVLITLMCLKCRQVKPLAQFGLRPEIERERYRAYCDRWQPRAET